jgi:hypothetical protein
VGAGIIVFHLAGHDEDVQRAESRLVAIAVLRSGLGTSDRRSIQAILATALQRLTFAESVTALRWRQRPEGGTYHRPRCALREGL